MKLREQPDILAVLEKLLKAYECLLPGLAHIAVEDYALINEAPIQAREAIRELRELRSRS